MEKFTPSIQLHREVKAAFMLSGRSLTQWCKEHGLASSSARQALVGSWNGPAGKKLRGQIIKASGLNTMTIHYPQKEAS